MALLGKPNAYLGLDIGTSSLKIVELLNRHRRIEVATYAEANIPNLLITSRGNPDDAVRRIANVISQMLERASVSTDAAIAALPSSLVFSTVLNLPNLPPKKMNEAVHFAARDVVPANLADVFLGWSRVGSSPHMEGGPASPPSSVSPNTLDAGQQKVPVFITAAPRDIVERYSRVTDLVGLELVALEVETFPLVRSLLTGEHDSAMIVDIGDQTTTYHLIDQGTPRISHSIDYGGANITSAVALALQEDKDKASQDKAKYGVLSNAPAALSTATLAASAKMITEAQRLIALYTEQAQNDTIKKTVLIGGGAKLPGLSNLWAEKIAHQVQVGNPWRGLSYPDALQPRMSELGPTYGVAVGLAQRGINGV